MLSANANDALVVLIRYVERYGSWHLLFDQVKAVPSCVILCTTNIDVEVIFIEAVEYDLDVAWTGY